MKRFILLAIVLLTALSMQGQAPDSDRQTLTTLLAEVKQLRLAIESSTLLGARTQIALQKIQLQEARRAKVAQELADLRRKLVDEEGNKAQMSAMLSERQPTPVDPREQAQAEQRLKALKIEVEGADARIAILRARESELAGQLQMEQARLDQAQSTIDEMERVLDAAIKQMTGQR